MHDTKKRLAVLISGRGSNMAALLDACRQGHIHGEIVAVVSNKADAAGLDVAREAGIPALVVDHRSFANREEFDAALFNEVMKFAPDFVVLAGFMRILTAAFVRPLAGKLINIHPSLLPKYPGLDTHQRAIDAGDAEAGATVHFVTEQLDGGPGIIHAKVPILAGDSADDLARRVLAQEHRIYTEAVRLLCSGQIAYDAARGALCDGEVLPPSGLTYSER
ncbi:MAG: phosphoribosylglycinamide formyltransferase [Porticoccaceae bacterium]